MFTANHILVTVASARNLPSRGKTGKLDAFVVIQLNETKFQTSVKQKTVAPVWDEECEFFLPNKYSLLVLLVYHRTFLGLDEFLGQVRLPLDEIYELNEKPRNRWYPLKGKSGKKDEHKYRGEVELRLEFSFKQPPLILSDDQRKHSTSSDKQSSLNDIKSAVKNALAGHKKDTNAPKKETGSKVNQKSSGSLSFANRSSTLPHSAKLSNDYESDREISSNKHELPQRNTSLYNINSVDDSRLEPLTECDDHRSCDESDSPVETLNHNKTTKSFAPRLPTRINVNDKLKAYSSAVNIASVDLIYETMTKTDLIEVVNEQRIHMGRQERRIRELEDYIDQLVVRVMNVQPNLLQGPFMVHQTKWKF